MAKAKVLTDRVSITSDVFTDENLERIKLIAPSILELRDEADLGTILYQVTDSDYNTFTVNGAAFKNGKTICTLSDTIMNLDDEAREKKIKLFLSAVLTKLNILEETATEYLENAVDLSNDIDFLD